MDGLAVLKQPKRCQRLDRRWHSGLDEDAVTAREKRLQPLPSSAAQDQPGRFIWQLVGVLATNDGYSFTGASVMPVFSGL